MTSGRCCIWHEFLRFITNLSRLFFSYCFFLKALNFNKTRGRFLDPLGGFFKTKEWRGTERGPEDNVQLLGPCYPCLRWHGPFISHRTRRQCLPFKNDLWTWNNPCTGNGPEPADDSRDSGRTTVVCTIQLDCVRNAVSISFDFCSSTKKIVTGAYVITEQPLPKVSPPGLCLCITVTRITLNVNQSSSSRTKAGKKIV